MNAHDNAQTKAADESTLRQAWKVYEDKVTLERCALFSIFVWGAVATILLLGVVAIAGVVFHFETPQSMTSGSSIVLISVGLVVSSLFLVCCVMAYRSHQRRETRNTIGEVYTAAYEMIRLLGLNDWIKAQSPISAGWRHPWFRVSNKHDHPNWLDLRVAAKDGVPFVGVGRRLTPLGVVANHYRTYPNVQHPEPPPAPASGENER